MQYQSVTCVNEAFAKPLHYVKGAVAEGSAGRAVPGQTNNIRLTVAFFAESYVFDVIFI